METKEQLENEAKTIKENQDEYFRLITTGHCAICLAELDIDEEFMKLIDTSTCSDCHEKGWDSIFQRGVLCGKELKEWKKENK